MLYENDLHKYCLYNRNINLLEKILDQFYYVSIYKTHFIIHRSFLRHMNKKGWLNVYAYIDCIHF